MSQLRKVLDENKYPKFIILSGGLIAGFSEIITTYPLDTIKTNIQVYPKKYKNSIHCFKEIYTNYGIRPFFNGMSASLAQVGGKAAIRFSIYDLIFNKLKFYNGNSNMNSLYSGIIAGSFEALVWTAPTERIKILQQKKTKIIPTSLVLRNQVKKNGFFSLYIGTFPTILKQSTSVGSRFWLYSILKNKFVKDDSTIFTTILIGGISGSFSAAINQPFDVIKSVIQSKDNKKMGFIETTKIIINNHGITGLFKGLNARILRVGIAQAVTFSVYETYVSYMKKYY